MTVKKRGGKMNIFDTSFLDAIRTKIIEIVYEAVNYLVKQKDGTRYMQQKEARAYVGGIGFDDFKNNFVGKGLKEIRIEGALRYDKHDIDEFMAKHKL